LAKKDDSMLTEFGQSVETPEEYFIGLDPITAILPHPLHGRLVERILLMVTRYISLEGVRYGLSWRDGALAYYQPVTPG
jgi:hypothetical protein